MRPTLLLRAGQYTPKIQFMGQKWKEAKSKSISYRIILRAAGSLAIPREGISLSRNGTHLHTHPLAVTNR